MGQQASVLQEQSIADNTTRGRGRIQHSLKGKGEGPCKSGTYTSLRPRLRSGPSTDQRRSFCGFAWKRPSLFWASFGRLLLPMKSGPRCERHPSIGAPLPNSMPHRVWTVRSTQHPRPRPDSFPFAAEIRESSQALLRSPGHRRGFFPPFVMFLTPKGKVPHQVDCTKEVPHTVWTIVGITVFCTWIGFWCI